MAANHRALPMNAVVSGVIQSGKTINKGDLVLQDSSGYPYAAAGQAWNTSLLQTQTDAKALFLGVALENGIAGQKILVATDGEFEFPIASGTPNIGGPVSFNKDTGNNILSNSVITVTAGNTSAAGIGRVTKQVGTNVWVRIFSVVLART